MEIIGAQQLCLKLRELCNDVRRRLWIASPYIGGWNSVRRILGRNWFDDAEVSVRLLTDAGNASYVSQDTVKHFDDRGDVKHIPGLHAKIYICDETVLIASANLTKTAFTKRHEVGVLLTGQGALQATDIFERLWHDSSSSLPKDWAKRAARRHSPREDEPKGEALPTLFKLPPDPGDPAEKQDLGFLDYDSFCEKYKDFADSYASVAGRVWSKSPLFFETDSFLNYLYHEAPGVPSKKYEKAAPRQLTEKQRAKEIRRLAAPFHKWVSQGGDDDRRDRSAKKVKTLLSRKHMPDLDRDRIKQVVDQLNCMNSVHIVKSKFLNPRNNSEEAIRNAWQDLFYGGGELQARMTRCERSLVSFGRSSVHELLGFFDPAKYPLRNKNSSAGLRFFGYDVSPK
jgi:hypothetical protein